MLLTKPAIKTAYTGRGVLQNPKGCAKLRAIPRSGIAGFGAYFTQKRSLCLLNKIRSYSARNSQFPLSNRDKLRVCPPNPYQIYPFGVPDKPAVSTSKSFVTTNEPLVKTFKSFVETNDPLVSTFESKVKTSKSFVTTNGLLVSTFDPAVSTFKSLVTTNESFVSTNRGESYG
jgi:hypothetical protein